MRRLAPPLFAVLLLLAGFGLIQVVRGQGSGEAIVTREVQGENLREVVLPAPADLQSQPDISFIDSPTVVCYQPNASQDTCRLNWYYMAVDADPSYMIFMTVTVAPQGIVARVGGFFQTSMYVPYSMYGDGFQVACGPLGAGGNPALGNAYSWSIQARDSAGQKSANYGTAYCPAYIP